MDGKLIWLLVFVALYWGYCIFCGVKSAATSRTATDYFIAGRSIGLWVFILAATATSFSGWTFMGHPGAIYKDGFQYAYASFCAITIPFTGVIFLKRQWMLGKHFGFVTPGEMFAAYFRSDLIRLLVVLVALVFSVPYLGLQLRASGFLFNALTDGALSAEAGMWMLSLVVAIYIASGGLRAVAYVDTIQAVLLAIGFITVGITSLTYVGGWGALNDGIAALALIDDKLTPEGYSHYVAIPGVIQQIDGLDLGDPGGGHWGGVMLLTYLFALMGIQAAPAFSMWAFANRSPEPFAPQQVWASSLFIGLLLMLFATFQGIGGHFLGADVAMNAAHPELVNDVMSLGLGGVDLMQFEGAQGALVPQLIQLMSDAAPWFVGLLAVCALAAMQSTGASYISTFGAMLTRDVIKRFILPDASHAQQKLFGRIGVIGVVVAALVVATVTSDALVLLGGLAMAYGFQMFPALIAICWWPFLTRQGVVIGLIAGLIAVTLTESIGAALLPWGRWPLAIHSAGWGIICNLGLAILVSLLTQNESELRHKMAFHSFLREHDSLPEHKKGMVPAAWIITILWFFFAIGPGAVVGNDIFGDPMNAESWLFGMPSIWAWQLLWWALGVCMMWFLAYRMELATVPKGQIEALVDDVGDRRAGIEATG